MTTENYDIKKKFFADLIISGKTHFQAAVETFPFDQELRQLATTWINDDFVKKIVRVSCTEGLPTKDEFAKQIYDDAIKQNDPYAKEKLYKLFASTMGFISKPSDVTVNNNVTTNKVMVVYEQASQDDWEKRAINQQEALRHETDAS